MPKCKFCCNTLTHTFVDFGTMPSADAFIKEDGLETYFPLRVYVCEKCMLVQAREFSLPENIFTEYAYFSSVSQGWLSHCKEYCNMMLQRYSYDSNSFIVEIASNDGYLLKNFVDKSIPVLGVEPAKNIALAAEKKGVPTLPAFFCANTAQQIICNHGKADLILGNNVYAHAPNINDFTEGLKKLLKSNGVITLEFPSVLNLIHEVQFDTIYNEHAFYLSLFTVSKVFKKHGLRIFNVDKLSTHGGSLRIYACHENDNSHVDTENVRQEIEREVHAGLDTIGTYLDFDKKVKRIKWDTLRYLIGKKEEGKRIIAFGAAAKASTFLNYCGIGRDFIDYVIDETPYKQGLFMPGAHIPVFPMEKLINDTPDVVVILPWNWKDEILKKISFIKEHGGKAVIFIPKTEEYF